MYYQNNLITQFLFTGRVQSHPEQLFSLTNNSTNAIIYYIRNILPYSPTSAFRYKIRYISYSYHRLKMESTFGCENKLCLGLFLHLFVLGFGGLFATLRSSRSGATTGTTSHVLPNLGNSLVGGIKFRLNLFNVVF